MYAPHGDLTLIYVTYMIFFVLYNIVFTGHAGVSIDYNTQLEPCKFIRNIYHVHHTYILFIRVVKIWIYAYSLNAVFCVTLWCGVVHIYQEKTPLHVNMQWKKFSSNVMAKTGNKQKLNAGNLRSISITADEDIEIPIIKWYHNNHYDILYSDFG